MNGTEITDRQHDMLDIVDEYVAAWSATDGDAVASFVSLDAYVEYPELEEVCLVSDGTLQERVANGPYATPQAHAPALVYGDRVVPDQGAIRTVPDRLWHFGDRPSTVR